MLTVPPSALINTKPGLLARDYKLSSIDVLCGRGKGSRQHTGNKKYKQIIENSLKRYSEAPKRIEKSTVVASIVEALRESGTFFVKKDTATGRWYDIGDIRAREKTGHAIRDCLAKMARKEGRGKLCRDVLPLGTESSRRIRSFELVNNDLITSMPASPSPQPLSVSSSSTTATTTMTTTIRTLADSLSSSTVRTITSVVRTPETVDAPSSFGTTMKGDSRKMSMESDPESIDGIFDKLDLDWLGVF